MGRTTDNMNWLLWLITKIRISIITSTNLLIAALKPSCKAGSFEYNKPYIWEFLFFALRGGRLYLGVKITFWFIKDSLWQLYSVQYNTYWCVLLLNTVQYVHTVIILSTIQSKFRFGWYWYQNKNNIYWWYLSLNLFLLAGLESDWNN